MRALWEKPELNENEKKLALKKLAAQIVSDIKGLTDALDLPGSVSYASETGRDYRYYVNSAKVPIMTIEVSFEDKNLRATISPVRDSGTKYPLLFRYLMKKKDNIRDYVAVFFDKEYKELVIDIRQ